jgi:hypothetical protein
LVAGEAGHAISASLQQCQRRKSRVLEDCDEVEANEECLQSGETVVLESSEEVAIEIKYQQRIKIVVAELYELVAAEGDVADFGQRNSSKAGKTIVLQVESNQLREIVVGEDSNLIARDVQNTEGLQRLHVLQLSQ